jgi:hypothetical protein
MIQNQNYTYNGVLNILESFASAHMDVRRFVAEDEDQMSEMTSKEELFPMMFVAPINNIYDWEINQYELRIYVYDRLMKDRSNINDIRSKTNQILNDLDVWLRKYNQLPFEVTNVSTAYPFSSELMTDVTGWYFDVVLDIPSYEPCKIPFENPVVITGYTCDIQYFNEYLTCSQIVDCPTIIDINNNISTINSDIDNIESQLTGITQSLESFYIALNFVDLEEFVYVAPETFKIVSIDNPSGLTITITVNDVAYVLGDTINELDVVKINVDVIGFIKLNCEII